MACTATLTGIAYDCGSSLSGVRTIYIANDSSVNGVTVAEGEISAIDASAGSFKPYVPAKNTGALTKTMTKDEATGVRYYTNEITANFNRMDAAKRTELTNIDGGIFKVVVEDKNGTFWYLGKDNYVSATVTTGQTGAGLDDGNFYTLTLQDISAELPYPLSADGVATFKTLIG